MKIEKATSHTVLTVRIEKATSHTDYSGDRESHEPHSGTLCGQRKPRATQTTVVIEKATSHTDYYIGKVVSCEDRESHEPHTLLYGKSGKL